MVMMIDQQGTHVGVSTELKSAMPTKWRVQYQDGKQNNHANSDALKCRVQYQDGKQNNLPNSDGQRSSLPARFNTLHTAHLVHSF